MTQFPFCPCAEHPSASLCTQRSWWEDESPAASLSSALFSSHFYNRFEDFQNERTHLPPHTSTNNRGRMLQEKTALLVANVFPRSWKQKLFLIIWRGRWGKNKVKCSDLPTWVMTHCTLCSSPWTDISSSLSQLSISGVWVASTLLPFSLSPLLPLSLSAATPPPVSLPFHDSLLSFCSVIQYFSPQFLFLFFLSAASCFHFWILQILLSGASALLHHSSSEYKQSQSPGMTMMMPLPASQQNSKLGKKITSLSDRHRW